jgi:hypothetical protein
MVANYGMALPFLVQEPGWGDISGFQIMPHSEDGIDLRKYRH